MLASKRSILHSLISFGYSLYVAKCWILRLHCKTEGAFDIKKIGYALEKNVMSTATTTLESCMEECFFTSGCKSINFKEDDWNNCEFNNETEITSKKGKMQPRPGWDYYATNQSGKLIGSTCKRLNPCNGAYCIDQCECPGYRCAECGGAYEKSYGWYCLNGGADFSSDSKLHVTSSGSSLSVTYSELVDGVKTPSISNCPILNRIRNYLHFQLDGVALIHAVAIQGFGSMVDIPLHIGFHFESEGIHHYPQCSHDARLTYKNQYKRFICPDGTKGTDFWIQPFPDSLTLEICEVEVFGTLL